MSHNYSLFTMISKAMSSSCLWLVSPLLLPYESFDRPTKLCHMCYVMIKSILVASFFALYFILSRGQCICVCLVALIMLIFHLTKSVSIWPFRHSIEFLESQSLCVMSVKFFQVFSSIIVITTPISREEKISSHLFLCRKLPMSMVLKENESHSL